MIDRRLTILKDVVIHPKSALREINENGKSYFFAAIAILVALSIGSELLQVDNQLSKLTGSTFEKTLQFFLIGASIGVEFLITGLVLYVGRFLKGKANFRGLFSSFQYAGVIPAILMSTIISYMNTSILPSVTNHESHGLIKLLFVGSAMLPVFVWSIILSIIACREAHGFSTGRSIATFLISGLIIAIIAIVIILSSLLGSNAFMGAITPAPSNNHATYSASTVGIKVNKPVGDMAFNSVTNKLYAITNPSIGTGYAGLLVIDSSKNELIQQIRFSHLPLSVAVNPNTNLIYVGRMSDEIHSYKSVVDVINGANYQIISSIEVGESAKDIAINTNTNMVYVANFWSDSVSVIDGLTNKVVKTIMVGKNPTSIAVDSTTNKIYVTNNNSGRGDPYDDRIFVIDGKSLQVSNIIQVGKRPWEIDVNPITNIIYVTSLGSWVNGSSTISVINGSSDKILKTIEVAGKPIGLTVNPISNKIYVINSDPKTVSVIDGQTDKIKAEILIGDSLGESSIITNPDSNLVYLGSINSESIRVINGTSDKLIEFEK
ncbi:MAG TPA: YIP1 family protein [Nitrosopumilaceae archaeon]|nr:YIP1 family protein [Nitrosopumilaceae archaeon]